MANSFNEIREKLIAETKKQVKEKYSSRDLHLVKAVSVIDELDESFNELSEHCIEWFGMHFPELQLLLNDNEVYLNCVLLGERKNFSKKYLIAFYKNEKKIEEILSKVNTSMGANLSEKDLIEIQSLARNALNLKKFRKELVEFIEQGMKEVAPNFSYLCGGLLGARFLAHSGSLEKLAFLPSSTLQVLGAEKSLFQHLKTHSNPPKHGYLFQHPMLKELKPKQKGKIARALAAKLAIAVKEDFFGKAFIAKDLEKSLLKRLEQVKGLRN